jgi:hypothetical protein
VLGGFRTTSALAQRGRALGARIVISHALESPIGLAACAHLALTMGEGIHGLAPHRGLGSFVALGRAIGVPSWMGPTRIDAPSAAGLG